MSFHVAQVRSYLGCALAIGFLLTYPHYPCRADAYAPASAQQIGELKQLLQPILHDPALVAVNLSPGDFKKAQYRKSFGEFFLEFPEKLEYSPGIHLTGGSVNYRKSPVQVRFATQSRRIRVIEPGTRFLGQKECRQIGVGFLRRHFQWFFGKETEKTFQANKPKGYLWEFNGWQESEDGFVSAWATVEVRAIDGKITSFLVFRRKQLPPKHTVPRQQALTVAKTVIVRDTRFKGGKLTGVYLSAGEHGRAVYEADVKFPPPLRDVQRGRIVIDANTGLLVWRGTYVDDSDTHGEVARNRMGSHVQDYGGVWTSEGLLFISTRALAGYPPDLIKQAQTFVMNSQLRYLTMDLIAPPEFFSGVAGSPWITLERYDIAYALNLQTGQYITLSRSWDEGHATVISPDGSWAVWTRNTGDSDSSILLAERISGRHGMNPQVRSQLLLRGSVRAKSFSPDGKWLYFLTFNHTPKEPDLGFFSLQRIAVENLRETGVYRLASNEIESICRKLPDSLERINISKDGQSVLLNDYQGAYVCSVPDGKCTRILTGPLSYRGQKLSYIRGTCFGPVTGKVVFTATTIRADGKSVNCLYSGNLNGSEIETLTPEENNPATPYQFPEGNKSVCDLAKEWVVEEIQESQKKPRD